MTTARRKSGLSGRTACCGDLFVLLRNWAKRYGESGGACAWAERHGAMPDQPAALRHGRYSGLR